MKKSADAPKGTRTKKAAPDAEATPKRPRAPRKTRVGAENGAPPEDVAVVELVQITVWSEPTVEDVARRAYEIFRSRAWHEGDALSDWVQAERELRKPR